MTPDTPNGHWLTVSELAASRGLAKASVSERLKRLQAQGVDISTMPGKGNRLLVNVAEYDRAVGTSGDPARALATKAPLPDAGGAEHVYTREQAREKAYKADLAKLDLDERLGKLVAVEALAAAAGGVAEAMVRAIDQMPGRAEDLAAAVAKDGMTGARAALKTFARELRETLARELARLADIGRDGPATPDTDDAA